MQPLALKLLQELYENAVQNLLDDPSFLFDEDDDDEPRSVVKWITMFLYAGNELGLDFWRIVDKVGSPVEIEGLEKIFRDHGLPWRAGKRELPS